MSEQSKATTSSSRVGGEGGVRCVKAKTGKKSLCSGLV